MVDSVCVWERRGRGWVVAVVGRKCLSKGDGERVKNVLQSESNRGQGPSKRRLMLFVFLSLWGMTQVILNSVTR